MSSQKSSIPDAIVAGLFARMEALWGERFHRLWLDCDMAAVRTAWCESLNGMSIASFKRGMAALIYEKSPPDLPRFVELCRGVVVSTTSAQPALTGPRVITPAAAKALGQLAAARADHASALGERRYIEWAYKIIRQAEVSAEPLNRLTIARQAVENRERAHGSHTGPTGEPPDMPERVPSPHIYGDGMSEAVAHEREPGEDDEPLLADGCTNNEGERP